MWITTINPSQTLTPTIVALKRFHDYTQRLFHFSVLRLFRKSFHSSIISLLAMATNDFQISLFWTWSITVLSHLAKRTINIAFEIDKRHFVVCMCKHIHELCVIVSMCIILTFRHSFFSSFKRCDNSYQKILLSKSTFQNIVNVCNDKNAVFSALNRFLMPKLKRCPEFLENTLSQARRRRKAINKSFVLHWFRS